MLLSDIPNPTPLLATLILFGIIIYYFRPSTLKIVLAVISLFVTLWLMIGINDTATVGRKCASETNKPFESRDIAKI